MCHPNFSAVGPRAGLAALVLFSQLAPTLCLAEEAAEADAPVPVEPSAPAPVEKAAAEAAAPFAAPPTPAAEETAAGLYCDALELLVDAKWDEAAAVLQSIVDQYPGTAGAARAQTRLAALDDLKTDPAPVPASAGYEDGRAELIVSQTLMATWVAINLPWAIGIDEPQGYAAASLVGAGVGLGMSTALTKDVEITKAMASSIYWGELWTGFNLSFLTLGIDPELVDSKVFNLANIAGPALGLGLGYQYQKQTRLDAGQVSLAFGSAFWGAVWGELLAVAFVEQMENVNVLFLAPVVVGDLGLVLGTKLAQQTAISRSRMRLVNLGGLLGGLVTSAGLVIIQPDLDSPAALSITYLASTAAGVGLAWLATQDWDRTRHPELFTSRPVPALLAVEGGRLRMGDAMPMPYVASFSKGEGRQELAPGVQVGLIGGVW